MTDWPNAARNLDPYIELLLEDLPYSAADDGLSENFPLLTNKYDSLRLSPADEVVLSALSGKKSKPDSFLYGQARLLVYASDSGAKQGCKYCGCCMAGCAYGSIYKASAEIEELASKGLIEYKPGCLVDSVTDSSDSAVVSFWEKDTKKELKTDQLFLAAGAVNTTRIVMNSLDSYEQPTRLKSRGGYLVPIFSFRRLPMVWPATNTQPGVFVELNGKGLKNWVHIQISTENELLYKRLNYSPEDKGIVAFGKKFILEHVAIGFVNFHSDYGPEYELERRVDTESGGIVLHSKKIKSFSFYWVSLVVSVRLLYHLLPRGLLPVIPASISNSGSYHVGGTLPMRESPTETFETDVLGRPANWKRVFVVDTASFPSLPGTSIGLATMANAMRIALGAIGLKSR
jgi:ferredoxin